MEKDINVLYMIGQAMGIISALICIICPFFNKKWQILVSLTIVNVLMALNYIFIGEFGSSVLMIIVAVLQNVVSLIHIVKKIKVTLWENMIFIMSYIGFGILGLVTAPNFVPTVNRNNLLQLSTIFASLINMLSIFERDEQKTRWYAVGSISIWLIYTAVIGAATFFTELTAMISTLVAIYKYRNKFKTKTA